MDEEETWGPGWWAGGSEGLSPTLSLPPCTGPSHTALLLPWGFARPSHRGLAVLFIQRDRVPACLPISPARRSCSVPAVGTSWITGMAPVGFLRSVSHPFPVNRLVSKACGSLLLGNLNGCVHLLPAFPALPSSLDGEILGAGGHLAHLCVFRPSTELGT